ncbi:hypothetical protein MuYL_4616 [Mucilaginibacter xinganensis]|uniref:Uncharacterized protein n=1 Tax=Mucilaginibacter xinganensis TaxID=1234841 RepID=A0A223P2Y0_9SPHI|nr:hypothetical protein MuYL_4616 [Mucilaginibacter xinganensis]
MQGFTLSHYKLFSAPLNSEANYVLKCNKNVSIEKWIVFCISLHFNPVI